MICGTTALTAPRQHFLSGEFVGDFASLEVEVNYYGEMVRILLTTSFLGCVWSLIVDGRMSAALTCTKLTPKMMMLFIDTACTQKMGGDCTLSLLYVFRYFAGSYIGSNRFAVKLRSRRFCWCTNKTFKYIRIASVLRYALRVGYREWVVFSTLLFRCGLSRNTDCECETMHDSPFAFEWTTKMSLVLAANAHDCVGCSVRLLWRLMCCLCHGMCVQHGKVR